MLKTPSHFRPTALSLALVCVLTASGCSSISNTLAGDKVDYRNSGVQSVNLAVPPDLTQLSGQSRYAQGQPSTVNATSMTAPLAADSTPNASTTAVASSQAGLVKLERNGQNRWLSVALPPEKIWEQVKAFWLEAGFELTVDQPATGLLETNWSENRAKLPQTGLRKVLGGLIDSLYDTGERDQYRTRIERTAQGSEIYISHHGVMEVYENDRKDQTKWVGRPADTALESEMLSRLMLKLGAPKDAAAAAKAETAASAASSASTAAPARAHLLPDGVSLSADDDFETVWRRVGLALDRSGYTIEDRDRTQGTYEIRLARGNDPTASKPGFFARLFGASDAASEGLARYRVQIIGAGNKSTIKVLNTKGQAESSDTSRRITKQLLDDLI
ncbi:MAG: outer membrane protein assembly factor BamC [Burkholderiales bacterium]|nr:outer membrane protein assembly factor BamC [Burkholderiales bacterium]